MNGRLICSVLKTSWVALLNSIPVSVRYGGTVLPPQALPALLNYFDGVDMTVTSRLLRKRSWLEVALTQLLCDLLDEETADDYRRPYMLEQFRSDLALAVPLVDFDCTLLTHEYAPGMERWVTQSDIGLTINYVDHFLPHRSWQTSWLLQAKRLYPRRYTAAFDESSSFEAENQEQHKRILALNARIGYDMVKYMLYCPRSDALDDLTAAKLSHLRDVALDSQIFDYAGGLALYREFVRGGVTLSAGLIVAKVDPLPTTLGRAHAAIFDSTLPLSWFLALQLAGGSNWSQIGLITTSSEVSDIAARLASGDPAIVDEIAQATGRVTNARPFPVLPSRTLRIVVAAGGLADPERRRVRNE